MNKLERLLVNLNSLLIEYYSLTIKLRNVSRRLKESDDDKLLLRKKDLKRRIDDTLEMITDIYNQIDEYFNEGYFSEMTKDVANSISDEYIEVINNMDPILFMSKLSSMKKFPDLLDKNEYLQKEFDGLSENIRIYNKKVDVENWSFKIIDPDKALKYYKDMRSKISENLNRFK